MNDLRRIVSVALAFVLVMAPYGFAQGDTPNKPLTEEALWKLIKGEFESEVITALIKKRVISYTVDADSLKRFKQAGANAAVLAAVRAMAADSEAEFPVKFLATEKRENGLEVEVTEVKPNVDRPLLTIR